MQTVQDTLGGANYIYHRSTDIAQLEEKAASLEQLLLSGWLNDKNRESAEALLWRVRAKILALAYFTGGYNADDGERLISFAEENGALAREKGYSNTAELLEGVAAFGKKAQQIMADAAAQACRVRTYDWKAASSSEEECREVAAAFKEIGR